MKKLFLLASVALLVTGCSKTLKEQALDKCNANPTLTEVTVESSNKNMPPFNCAHLKRQSQPAKPKSDNAPKTPIQGS